MGTTFEVVGWLLVDASRPQVMVREANGDISLQASGPGDSFSQRAIQTGRFQTGRFDRSDLDYTSGTASETRQDQPREGRAQESLIQKG